MSLALSSLEESLEDVDILLNVHRRVTGGRRGRRGRDANVLNRSGIVLATAAWEAFLEDVAQEAFTFLMRKARTHAAFPNALKVRVVDTLLPQSEKLRFWALAGEGYKPLLRRECAMLRAGFHTPDSASYDDFLLRTVGLRGTSRKLGTRLSKPLDRFVELRHRIAHGRQQQPVRRAQVEKYRALLGKAANQVDGLVADAVEGALRRERPPATRRVGRPERLRPWD